MMDDIRLNIDDNLLYDAVCAGCDCEITPDNDSGWYVFVDVGASQKMCKVCWDKRDNEGEVMKAVDDDDNG